MCKKIEFVIVSFRGVSVNNDSITGVGNAVYQNGISIAMLPYDNPQFFIDKDDDGVDTLYAIKSTDAPLICTFTNAGTVTASALIGPHRPHRPSVFEYPLHD